MQNIFSEFLSVYSRKTKLNASFIRMDFSQEKLYISNFKKLTEKLLDFWQTFYFPKIVFALHGILLTFKSHKTDNAP